MLFRTAALALCLALLSSGLLRGALPLRLDDPTQTFRVEGGILHQRDLRAEARADSLARAERAAFLADSLAAVADSLAAAGVDTSAVAAAAAPDTSALGQWERRREALKFRLPGVTVLGIGTVAAPAGQAGGQAGAQPAAGTAEAAAAQKNAEDSVHVRHNWLFPDSIPISRITALSLVLPGIAQLYNNQPWKVPVLYVAVGVPLYFGIRQNKTYQFYKKRFDAMKYVNTPQEELDPWQQNMIRHNTYRQIFFGTAIAAYIYFIGDGVINYPGQMTDVKKATTLSTICPGAGQVYNGKFWKLPIVVGGLATLGYVIDWNNRGYQRFKLAYNQVSAGVDDEFHGAYPASFLQNLRNAYRRNRDMSIILTGAFYLLNIIDAHVDAQMKTYDMGDDITMNVLPYFDTLYASGRPQMTVGMSFNVRF